MSRMPSPLAQVTATPQPAMTRLDDVEVPAHFSTVDAEVEGIRTATALSDASHICRFRLVGEDAYDVLDAICPLELFLRDGQIRHTLLLTDDGVPMSELYICNDDEDFILLSEGMDRDDLRDFIAIHMPADADAAIEDLDESHAILSLNGPFAWELLAAWLGPEIIGFPYLSFYRPTPDRIFFRTGKTGEFGYLLLVPREEAPAVWETLTDVGGPFELVWAGADALAHCGMENFFFDIWREGQIARAEGLTPIELQLQWRVSYEKSYPGSAALQRRRERGPTHRMIGVVSPSALEAEAPIFWQDRPIGRLLRVAPPRTLAHWIGLALVETAWAYSGIDAFTVGDQPLHTVSTPFVNNLSLAIKPQQHSYRERHLIQTPAQRW